MDKISAHITYEEATRTSVRVPNVPSRDQIRKMQLVAQNVFERARYYFDKPMYISSFFRCEEVNERIGGAVNSQHTKGEAIDIDCDVFGGVTNKQLFEYIKENLEFDQLIMEGGANGWVHVSYKETGNRQSAFEIPNP